MPKEAAKMSKEILTRASFSFLSEGAGGFEPPQAIPVADMHSASLGLSDTPLCC